MAPILRISIDTTAGNRLLLRACARIRSPRLAGPRRTGRAVRPPSRGRGPRRVSTATVSRVIAGTAKRQRSASRRVSRAARELDYRPNRVARNLRVRATRTIGVVIPDILNPFFTSVVRGIEDVLQAEDYTLLLGNSDGQAERERVYLDTLRAEGVAGILFVPSNGEQDAYRNLGRAGIPIVAIDRSPVGLDVDLVTVTNEEGAHAAVAHLLASAGSASRLIAGPRI